ncbi:MAG: DNA polymerase III subunit gamma/tau [Immundisolibacter sp.]|uniref:DNA polymerase III subunit gamma/tau n=1 Tax=Immundisolibacter sp. TaxID=1934948 RepID=UPI003D126B11
MSYQALARKWRPRRFADMVGQEHVRRALGNALAGDRLHHAYLFTGTRGVGKTTVARLFAKALNCEQGVSAEPCGECAACVAIDGGRFMDLIEVDAASRTGVDDTRELLENVQYAPTQGRYKVYLIDEVHMFSKSSFNALLKTLEEPPPHIKFLLATTDPQKIPATILSRCLQFNLRALTPEQVSGQLTRVLHAEQIAPDAAAVELIARAAAGSMRDALSLLDQALAHGGGQIEADAVRAMLGTLDRSHAPRLLDAVADADGAALLAALAEANAQAADPGAVLDDLLRLLHQIALCQAVPGATLAADADPAVVQTLAARLPAEDVQLYYQMALLGRRDLPLAPDPASGLEMLLLRLLVFRPAGGAGEAPAPPQAPHRAPAPQPVPTTGDSPAPARAPASAAPAAPRPAPPAPAADVQGAVAPGPIDDDWSAIVPRLGLRGAAQQLAQHCVLRARRGEQFDFAVDARSRSLLTPATRAALTDALSKLIGAAARVEFGTEAEAADTPAQQAARADAARAAQARETLEADPTVRGLMQTLDARLVDGSARSD